jgi:hypothetical protein
MKPPILSDEQFTSWCGEHRDDKCVGCRARYIYTCDAEAQRDADAAYYEPLIEQAKAEVAEYVEFMWKMIKYCPSCGSYLPQNLNGTRTHTCRNCDWSGESLKSKYTGGKK